MKLSRERLTSADDGVGYGDGGGGGGAVVHKLRLELSLSFLLLYTDVHSAGAVPAARLMSVYTFLAVKVE